jgi:hypothetical protein
MPVLVCVYSVRLANIVHSFVAHMARNADRRRVVLFQLLVDQTDITFCYPPL